MTTPFICIHHDTGADMRHAAVPREVFGELARFSSPDDPLDLFRGLGVAIPVCVFGFWLPIVALVTGTLQRI